MANQFKWITQFAFFGCVSVLISVFATSFLGMPQVLALDGFPIKETFRNSTAPGWVLGGNDNFKAKLTAGQNTETDTCTNKTPDTNGNGWLRLTENKQDQAGYAYFDTSFPTSHGVSIAFEYASFNGSKPGADGIGFFLFDGGVNQSTFNIGAYGGSFGYAQREGSIPGISKGYVGIGFDEYGNFSNATEGRQGGIGFMPDAVSLRGPGNGLNGYNYLTSTGTLPYSIDTSARGLTPGDAKYRKAFIDLVPSSTGYNISVRIQHGNTVESVINSYPVINPPATLKLGYSASTGSYTNCHEIRNLSINKPVDLKVNKKRIITSSSNPKVGDTVKYEIVALNEGPNSDYEALFNDNVPVYMSNVSWTCETLSGGGDCITKSGAGNTISSKIKLSTTAKVKFTVTGTLSSETPYKFTNTATILPSTEFTDIDLTDNSSTDTSTLDIKTNPLNSQGNPITNSVNTLNNTTTGQSVKSAGGTLLRTGGFGVKKD